MSTNNNIINFLLQVILYMAIFNLIDIIINRIKLLRNNKTVLYIILLWGSLYILINKYNYKFI